MKPLAVIPLCIASTLGLLFIIAACKPNASAPAADTIFHNGSVLTMAGKTPAYVEALAVKDGNIVFAGSKDEALKLKDGSTTAADLDPHFPDHPVMVGHVSLHGAVFNSLAFKKYNISADTPTPPGGIIIRKPGGNPNPIDTSVVAGIAGHGIVPGRPQDVFGLGYFYYDFSNDLQDATSPLVKFDDEQGTEVFYNLTVTQWFRMTADIQWIDSATGANDAAVVGALKTQIIF